MIRLLCVFLLVAAGSCKKETKETVATSHIAGQWVQVETYVNPGNGGRWVSVNNTPPLTVGFSTDGKVVSNHSFYTNYTNYRELGKDSLELTNNLGKKAIITYLFDADERLTILYTCIEGCGDRFIRKK